MVKSKTTVLIKKYLVLNESSEKYNNINNLAEPGINAIAACPVEPTKKGGLCWFNWPMASLQSITLTVHRNLNLFLQGC